MTRPEIIKKLKDILLVIDGANAENIEKADEDTRLMDGLGLNSVNVLYLVIAIEEVFDLRFDDEFGTDTFVTVRDLVDYIEDSLK
jgi:acyl carrier protein